MYICHIFRVKKIILWLAKGNFYLIAPLEMTECAECEMSLMMAASL